MSTELITVSTPRAGIVHHKPTCKRVKPEQVVGSPETYLDGKPCGFCSAAKALADFRAEQAKTTAADVVVSSISDDAAPTAEPKAPKEKTAKAGVSVASEAKGAVTVTVPSSAGQEAMTAVLDRLPASAGVRLSAGVLTVPDGSGEAFVVAANAHMATIIKEDRSANMYRARMIRRARDAYLAFRPAARPAKPTKESADDRAKAHVERLNADLAAAKAAKAQKSSAA